MASPASTTSITTFPKSPPIIELMDPLTGVIKEINFNIQTYFVQFGPATMIVRDNEVCEVVLNPEVVRIATLDHLMMSVGDGEARPGHLPNINDMYLRVDLAALGKRLSKMVYDLPRLSLSDFFKIIYDPAPVLDLTRQVYGFGSEEVEVKIGSHTDGLQVFAVTEKVTSIGLVIDRDGEAVQTPRREHRIKLVPTVANGVHFLCLGERIVLWNARGFCRPSLKENLRSIIDTYNPIVLVITETRVGEINFRRVYDKLDCKLAWDIDEVESLDGGVVVFWDQARANLDLRKSVDDNLQRFLGDITGIGGSDSSDSEK